MAGHSREEVRRYDAFKLIVLFILLLILALLLLRSCQSATPVSPPTAVVAIQNTATAPPPTAEPTAQPTATVAPTVAPTPALTSPKPGDTLAGGDLTLAGTGAPGSTVQIVVDGNTAGTAIVGDDGAWTLPIQLDASGGHEILLQALDTTGGVTTESQPATVNVEAATAPPALTSPGPADSLTSGEVVLAGTGAPGSTVQIVVDGNAAGTVVVGDDGTWTLPVALDASGEHAVVIQSLDAGGAVVAESEPVKLTVAASPTPTPTPAPTATPRPASPSPAACVGDPGVDQGVTWLVGACDTMTFISRRTGVSLQALIAANPQVKNPDVIFPGQVINIPGRGG